MKRGAAGAGRCGRHRGEGGAAAIVHLASAPEPAGDGVDPVARARAFAEPLLTGQTLDTGEDALGHADGVAAMLRSIGGAPSMCAAAYLVYAGDYLQRPEEVVKKAFGDSYASLVTLTRKLVQIQRAAREAQQAGDDSGQRALQTERVRKMLLAFSRDLRVVLLRLASRLQTLRWYAAQQAAVPADASPQESLQVFAPLANRLGIWQIKWELEDLSFRFLQPAEYQRMARAGGRDARRARAQRRTPRAGNWPSCWPRPGWRPTCRAGPSTCTASGRRCRARAWPSTRVFDARALRVIVARRGRVLRRAGPRARSLAPGGGRVRRLHRAAQAQRLPEPAHRGAGRARAGRWRCRSAPAPCTSTPSTAWRRTGCTRRPARAAMPASAPRGEFEERVAEARKAVLRELLAWERDFTRQGARARPGAAAFDDRIYVFTPQATIIDLPAGGTAVDFAYALHTDLGHRCRGARVDGAMVPLNKPLASGQTVEIVAAKEGGPSLDWLNPELGYLASPRSRAKVRAWFNAQAQSETIARGREAVEKLLQREGRTALKLDDAGRATGLQERRRAVRGGGQGRVLAAQHRDRAASGRAGSRTTTAWRCTARAADAGGGRGGVLVVGIDSLLTTLARCCRPAPPDAIARLRDARPRRGRSPRRLHQPAPHGADGAGPRHRCRLGPAPAATRRRSTRWTC